MNYSAYLLMRANTHGGWGHTDNESAQHFDPENLSQFFLVLRMGFEPLIMESIAGGINNSG